MLAEKMREFAILVSNLRGQRRFGTHGLHAQYPGAVGVAARAMETLFRFRSQLRKSDGNNSFLL